MLTLIADSLTANRLGTIVPRVRANPEESVCAAIVSDVLNARWQRVPEHSHDFDIVFADGRTDYLEVSVYTLRTNEARWRQSPAPRGTTVLRGTWTLIVTEAADLRTVQQRAEPHLLVLQQHDVHSFYVGDHYSLAFRLGENHPCVSASFALTRLEIEQADELIGSHPPQIIVAQQVSTAGPPSDLVVSAITSVATKADNIAKLTSSVAVTHLFVPLRIQGGGAWSAVAQGPPHGVRDFAPEINRVWSFGRARDRVIFSELNGAWQEVSVDSRVFDTPWEWEVAAQ